MIDISSSDRQVRRVSLTSQRCVSHRFAPTFMLIIDMTSLHYIGTCSRCNQQYKEQSQRNNDVNRHMNTRCCQSWVQIHAYRYVHCKPCKIGMSSIQCTGTYNGYHTRRSNKIIHNFSAARKVMTCCERKRKEKLEKTHHLVAAVAGVV